MHGRVEGPPRTPELAAAAACSPDALARRTRRVPGLSPGSSCCGPGSTTRSLLGGTDVPLSEVATACGSDDQPALPRQFARLAGEAPGQYRRRARRPG